MQKQQLERIRMLQNRMRRPSKISNQVVQNEQSLKTIKSTDSKKIVQMNGKEIEEKNEESSPHFESNIKLSDEEIKYNKKITDYFILKPSAKKDNKHPDQHLQSPIIQPQMPDDDPIKSINPNSQSLHTKSPVSPDPNKSFKNANENQSLRDQNKYLKDILKQKDQREIQFKIQIIDKTILLHQIKRNQMRMRVSTNKIRLGEFFSYKKNRDSWIDGTQIREIKQKIETIAKEKESLQKSKRQNKKCNKESEDPEQLKNTITSQMYFLSRQQSHLQQILKRLEEEKALHIKEYKLLYEEEHSRYGKFNTQTGCTSWPKIKKYQLLGLLGKGGFSEVYKAIDVDQLKECACKLHEFHPSWNSFAKENYLKHALRENNVLRVLSHPNIVRLYDTVEIDSTSFCTVLEYCEGPDLSYYLKKHKKIPEKEAKMIIKQVINAIKYLHDLPDKVIHYDLKPQNILFHKGKIKITDFGLCKITKEQALELTSQGVGTYWYLPPQCFETDKKAVISPKVDIWSIGVIYFEMLYGQKPFGNQMSQVRILNEGIMLKANAVSFPITQKGLISNQSKDFIRDCLKFQVEDRMDIRETANHKLFEKK